MARIAILGGAGFIGYHLTKHLAQSTGHRITIVDNLSRGQLDDDLERLLKRHPTVEFKVADLTDPGAYTELDGPFDHVYLLAGILGVQNVQQNPARVLKINTSIILDALEWIANVGCGRLLFASTSEAYGGSVELGMAPVPTDESVPLAIRDIQQPRSTYGLTKMLGESFVTHYADQFGFESVAVRFHNVYGPRMGFSHVVPEFMQRIHQRMNPLPVYGLDDTRAFCYVEDAVRACAALMQCSLDGPQIVNVGNDSEEVTIGVLLEKMLNVTGFRPEIQNHPSAPGGVARRCPDVGKLRALTGFEAKTDLEHGLSKTWEWYRERLDAEISARTAMKV